MARKEVSPIRREAEKLGKPDHRFKDAQEGLKEKQQRETEKWLREQTGR
jgi:hypothetical protein